MSVKGPWIIAGAIVLAAVLIVSAMFYRDAKAQECAVWQADKVNYYDAVRTWGSIAAADGAFPDYEPVGPAGCPEPNYLSVQPNPTPAP